MAALAVLRRRIHAFMWPEAPKAGAEPLTMEALGEKFGQVMFYGVQAHPAVTLDETILAVEAAAALEVILLDYRAGNPQTEPEKDLGRLLDHVAKRYFGSVT